MNKGAVMTVKSADRVLDLHEFAGIDKTIRPFLLLPGDLGETCTVRPWRNIPGSRGFHRDVIPEDETECVVVSAIGETDWFPSFEAGIEGESIELRLHRCESNGLHLSTGNSGW